MAMLARAVLTTLTTTLTVCPTSATILPLPAISPISTSLPATEMTYYQGLSPPSEAGVYSGTCNAIVVAQGQLTAGYCVILETYAVSIARLQGTECAFKMFKGSTNCEADATAIMNVSIPSGDGDVCLVTGVEDGGKFSQGSGFLVCG